MVPVQACIVWIEQHVKQSGRDHKKIAFSQLVVKKEAKMIGHVTTHILVHNTIFPMV